MNKIKTILETQNFIVLDGGLASALEERGFDLNTALWSAEILANHPAAIQQVHYDYFQAGADIAISASYQASFEGFAAAGKGEAEIIELLQLSVDLTKRARIQFWQNTTQSGKRIYPLVAASVGPYGAYLADGSEYRGDYGLSVAELKNFHRKRLAVLVAAKPDLLAVETIPSQKEAQALLELLAEAHPKQMAWMSFSCRNERQISDGTTWEELLPMLNAATQIVAVGANCTKPKYISGIISNIRANSKKPIIVYPNRGEDWDAEQHCWIPNEPSAAIDHLLEEWIALGAKLIGGCCRTNFETIRKIRHILQV
ncbi:MAG: homocysteine S-methyltransferase [Bacteroidota bacterium]